jgi:hypothetical protein
LVLKGSLGGMKLYKVILKNNYTGETQVYGPYKTEGEAKRESRNIYRRKYKAYKKQGSMATFSTSVIHVTKNTNVNHEETTS